MTLPQWTGPDQVVAVLRRRWTTGLYLAAAAQNLPFEPIGIPLKGPTAADATGHYEQARVWAESWAVGRHPHLRIQTKTIGGRNNTPANTIPERIWVDTRQDLWFLLGVSAQVDLFQDLHTCTARQDPHLAQWMATHPMKVLQAHTHWQQLVDTVHWIRDHESGPIYLRQVDVPGVDTKFIEINKGILGELLGHVLPTDRIHSSAPKGDFAARYGFLTKPPYVRLRYLGNQPGPFSEITVRANELTAPPPGTRTVFVLENEITYLSLPDVPGAIAILGAGYAAALLRYLPWLADVDLRYWGDIDTHGFAILSQVRRHFPHTRSFLMDSESLLAHRAHWGEEKTQTAETPAYLTSDEAEVDRELRLGTHRPHLRLEQERIPIRTVTRALAASGSI
ncbi:Wadjet anti-phage system protein JetD domain-containing protein [Streptomyces sp. NPDC001552]|uniref:Wadjet anti-phage system protein JetD domain-containing protein n=1 Tax=Streptomyces sp. NPDC001552 TaxID=3364587 RepID=UPI003691BD71